MNLFRKGLERYLKPDHLETIRNTSIGIAGAGGLGSNVAIALIRSGFSNIQIIDYDNIEPSNLNRQQYFIDEIGQSKVNTLRDHLLQINPDAIIMTFSNVWKPEESYQYFKGCDIVVEAFDHPERKKEVVEAYSDKTKYIVSGNGMAGLESKQSFIVRNINNIYIVGDQITDAYEGHPTLAPRVMACAALMAEVILDLTLDLPINSS